MSQEEAEPVKTAEEAPVPPDPTFGLTSVVGFGELEQQASPAPSAAPAASGLLQLHRSKSNIGINQARAEMEQMALAANTVREECNGLSSRLTELTEKHNTLHGKFDAVQSSLRQNTEPTLQDLIKDLGEVRKSVVGLVFTSGLTRKSNLRTQLEHRNAIETNTTILHKKAEQAEVTEQLSGFQKTLEEWQDEMAKVLKLKAQVTSRCAS